MASNDTEKMKEIILLSDDSFPLEIRLASFAKLVTITLKSDNLQLFDWLQSKHIPSEVKINVKFSVKNILDAVTFRSNNIILSSLKNCQKFEISNISQIKNTNGQNIFHLSAISHNNSLITSILMMSELPVEIKDSLVIGMKGLDVCDNTIFHSAVMAENVDFIDAIYNYILPFNLYGTPQYTLGFQHFSDQILLHRNFSKRTVYDLLQQLRDKSKYETLERAVTKLSQLLLHLNHIIEVRSYFAYENPKYDMPSALYLKLMSKNIVNTETALYNMRQILENDFSKLMSYKYLSYSVRMGYRLTVTYLISLGKSYNQEGTINIGDICGLYWKVYSEIPSRQLEFFMWDAVVQEAACSSYGKRSFWDDVFPSYDKGRRRYLSYLTFDHHDEDSNIEMARWLFLYSKKFALPDCSYFISNPTCDKIIAKSLLSYRLWLNSIMVRYTSRDLMPIISSYLFPELETSDSMLMKVTNEKVIILASSSHEYAKSNGMVEKTGYLASWLVMEAKADPYLKTVSQHCNGQTSLHLAIASNQILTVKWLTNFDSQLLFRECQSHKMLPINYAISMSTDTVGEDQHKDRTCIAMFLASAMAEVLAPYSTDQYAVVGRYLDSQERSIVSFVASCKSAKVKSLFYPKVDELEVHLISKEQFISLQNKAYLTLCDKISNNHSLQDIVKVCTDNGWMHYFKANKLGEVGCVAEHQFIYQSVIAQRCDVLDLYCSNVEGLLFPWLWTFNKDISINPGSGLLHTTSYYAEDDFSDLSINLYSTLCHYRYTLRTLATSLRLNSIIDWIEKCQSSEKVEAYKSKKWLHTVLLTYEGNFEMGLGFQGALQAGASIYELISLFIRGNQAISNYRNSLKYERNKILLDQRISKGFLTSKGKSSNTYRPILVSNVIKLYTLTHEKDDIYRLAFLHGYVHIIEWLVNMIPEDATTSLRIIIPVLEDVAVRLSRLDILKIIRESKHKKYCLDLVDIVRMAAIYSEFEIFCYFYLSIKVESERLSTIDVVTFLLNKDKLEDIWGSGDSLLNRYCQHFTSSKETEAEAILRKQRNCVLILKYVIGKSDIWPKFVSRKVARLFIDHKKHAADTTTSLRVPIELCMFLMEEMGFELCQILPLELFEDFPPLLRLHKKSTYELKVAHMIGSEATVAELEAFTELHCITPEAIRGDRGMPMTHLAAQYNRCDILEWLLLQKGSDIHTKDRYGNSIQQVAKHFNSRDIWAILVPGVVPVIGSGREKVNILQSPLGSGEGHSPSCTADDPRGSDCKAGVVAAGNVMNSVPVDSVSSSGTSKQSTVVAMTSIPSTATEAHMDDGMEKVILQKQRKLIINSVNIYEERNTIASEVSNDSGNSQQDSHNNINPLQNQNIESVNRNECIFSDKYSEKRLPLPSTDTEAYTDIGWEMVHSRKQRKLLIRNEINNVKDKPPPPAAAAPHKNRVVVPKETIGTSRNTGIIDHSVSTQKYSTTPLPLENDRKYSDNVNALMATDGQSKTSGSEHHLVAMSSIPSTATATVTHIDDGYWEKVTSRKERMRLTRLKK